MAELKDLLKKLRPRHGTQVEVARKLGIKSQQLSQYEGGTRNPKLAFYRKWKNVFGEDLQAILDETNASHGIENHTQVDKPSDNTEKPLGEDLSGILEKVESSKDYFVIPKSVLRENYRLVALEQFQMEKEKLEKERAEMKERAERDKIYLDAQIEANRDLSRKLDLLMAKLTDVQKSQ